ncbi:hypothetical protein BH18ACT9_BH18ACT9_19470 [soil metagenome]
MDTGTPVVLAVLCVALAGAVMATLMLTLRERRRLFEALAVARADLNALQARLDAVSQRLEEEGPEGLLITSAGPTASAEAERPETRGSVRGVRPEPPEPLGPSQFASVAVGESLVRVFAFGYGVRRALSPENRNRISFEMGREVRRARRQRRRDLKEAMRTHRSAGRHHLDEDAA